MVVRWRPGRGRGQCGAEECRAEMCKLCSADSNGNSTGEFAKPIGDDGDDGDDDDGCNDGGDDNSLSNTWTLVHRG